MSLSTHTFSSPRSRGLLPNYILLASHMHGLDRRLRGVRKTALDLLPTVNTSDLAVVSGDVDSDPTAARTVAVAMKHRMGELWLIRVQEHCG